MEHGTDPTSKMKGETTALSPASWNISKILNAIKSSKTTV